MSLTSFAEKNRVTYKHSREEWMNVQVCKISQFGLQIVPVSADGNCFFWSVAFQILQVMPSDCSAELSRHLQNLGISAEATTEDLQLLLRALLLEEWINSQDEYQSFIDPLEFESEVRRFHTNGEFAGLLADALPLGMANVLNIPLVIFTTVHNMPLIPVAPRRTVSNSINIFWRILNKAQLIMMHWLVHRKKTQDLKRI